MDSLDLHNVQKQCECELLDLGVIVHDNKTEQEEQECESFNCTNVSKYYKAIKPRDKPYPQRDSLVFND